MSPRGELPAGWVWAPLSQIGTWQGGGTPSKSVAEYWENGTVPWVSPKDMKRPIIDSAEDLITLKAIEESATNLVPPYSVLMVTRSGILRHSFPVAVNSTAVAINQDLKAWTPRDQVDPMYVAYYLKARAQEILESLSKDGTTVNSIDSAGLAEFQIALAPSEQQTRIVSRIEELLGNIEAGERALSRVQRLVKSYRQSVLKAAVSGELTQEWRSRATQKPESGKAAILEMRRQAWHQVQDNSANAASVALNRNNRGRDNRTPAPIAESDLTALPIGWAWASVEQAGEVRLGRQRAPQHHSGPHMRPYLRVANVYEDRLDLSDVMEMNFSPTEFETYELKSGDILLNEGQSPELVGRPAMYRGEIPGCCYQKTLLRFRARPGINPHFALLVFRSYLHSGRFRKSANITTSIAHLAAERFVGIEFPVPSEAEQAEIVEVAARRLSVLDALEFDLKARRTAIEGLRQSVFRAAFAGELVPQDPSDEPAAVLLERIARAGPVPPGTSRRRRN